MCGIFAYKGKKDACKQVFEGLKILEYRGYDSWGIALTNQLADKNEYEKSKILLQKAVGKIANAELKPEFLSINSKLAIGHTRWATHGGVTEHNAHPHLDCLQKIAIVHNGIIENFDKLKNILIKKGHLFKSETDSEIIAHLIEEEMKNNSFEKSFRLTFQKLEGLNAVVALDVRSDKIIAGKKGSPLVIGKNKDSLFISSDPSGILEHTKNLLFLQDNHMIVIDEKPKLISIKDGRSLNIKFEKANWENKFEEIGKFPHFMLKEIGQQALVIRDIAKNSESNLKKLAQAINNAKGTFFIGAGTAYHAGLVGTYLFSKIANEHVNTAVASEFNYLLDFINSKSLVIALSQSGETIDVIEPLNEAAKKNATIASMVNSPGSTIYRMSDLKIPLNAGIEKAVASTKAYTAKVAYLLMLSYILKGSGKEASRQLLKAANEINRIIKNKSKLNPIVEKLSHAKDIYLIGRGVSYPTALETALKIKEVSYIHAEGLAGGELKHGTIALITNGTPCIVFAPQDETYSSIISNAIEIKSRGATIIGIGAIKEPVFDYFIEVNDCLDANPIVQIIPGQLLAYLLALKKGFDPDKPRNLAKSVTVK